MFDISLQFGHLFLGGLVPLMLVVPHVHKDVNSLCSAHTHAHSSLKYMKQYSRQICITTIFPQILVSVSHKFTNNVFMIKSSLCLDGANYYYFQLLVATPALRTPTTSPASHHPHGQSMAPPWPRLRPTKSWSIFPNDGQPTYQKIRRFHDMVNENAVSDRSNLGGGNFGILGLTLSLAAYAVLSTTFFAAPPHPGTAPIIPHATTEPQISNIRRVFAKEEAVYQSFDRVVKALNTLLWGTFKTNFFHCWAPQMLASPHAFP